MQMHPKGKLIGFGILIAGLASFITSAQLDPITARVERVIDGDTIRVRSEGTSYTVRLLGVDTSETKHPTKTVEYFQRFYQNALRRQDRYPCKRSHRRHHGCWLRYVLLDGDNFNARLIREGDAHAYRLFPFSKRTEFIQLEEQARRRGIGLWNRR